MERLVYRSSSLLALQAELRQRDLLADIECRYVRVPERARRSTFLGLPLPGRRAHGP